MLPLLRPIAGIVLALAAAAAFAQSPPPLYLGDRGNESDSTTALRTTGSAVLRASYSGDSAQSGVNTDPVTVNVTAALRSAGFREDEIAKLWGGNLLRVWQAAIDARGGPIAQARRQ